MTAVAVKGSNGLNGQLFKQSEAAGAKTTYLFHLALSADGADGTGLVPVVTISKAGAAFAAAAGVVSELAGGWYKIPFTAVDLSTLGPLGIKVAVATADTINEVGQVVALDPYTATVNPGTGGIVAGSFAAGAIDATAIATDAIGSAEIAATGASEIVAALVTANAVGGATRSITKTFGALPLLNAAESNYLGMENALEMVVSLAGTWDGATVTLYTSENPEAGVSALWTAVASGAKTADATVTVTGPHKAVKATMTSPGAGSSVVVTGALRFAE